MKILKISSSKKQIPGPDRINPWSINWRPRQTRTG